MIVIVLIQIKTLIVNVSDQFKNQFIIENILVINLETHYYILLIFY